MRSRRALGVLIAASVAGGCEPTRPPGALEPFVRGTVVGGGRIETPDAALRPPPRRERLAFVPAQPFADLARVARALEARATALDALAPRATVEGERVLLEFALPRATWRSLVFDQLVRRGVLAIYVEDAACDPFADAELPDGIARAYGQHGLFNEPIGEPYLLARAQHARGVAPLAPLVALLAAHPAPAARQVLIGPVRVAGGDIARRTYCVDTREALVAPAVQAVEPTLDPHSLMPVLNVQLGPSSTSALYALTTRASGGRIVVAIDDEAIVAGTLAGPIATGRFRVEPQAPNSSVSPEVVAALLRSGPLPVALRAAPLQASPSDGGPTAAP